MSHLLDQLRELKVEHLWLEVSEKNKYAVRLYYALGGQVTGRRDRYYKDGSDARCSLSFRLGVFAILESR